jgi:hypothetical protein
MRLPYGAAVLLIVTLGVYAPTLGYGFVYEDLNDTARFLAPSSWASTTDRGNRMLTSWTYALSGVISPMEPMGYHLISVVIHAVNVGLLVWLASMIFAEAWMVLLCAGVFALHPLQVESVAYISARPDLVMTTFVILALIAAERERWLWMLLACVCAVLAKESGIVAAPLALLWAFWRLKRVPAWIFFSAIAVLGAITPSLVTFYGLHGFSLAYTATETAKFWQLLSSVIVPVGFTIDHAASWPEAWPMVTLIGTVALVALSCVSAKPWTLGLWFVLVALSPRLLIPLVEGLHEHHLYLPLVGLMLAVAETLQKGRYGISEALPQA